MNKNQLISSYYDMLRRHGELNSALTLTYRCSHGCVLAYVLTTKLGLAVHVPGYSTSSSVNATDEGRAKNTTDGVRAWKPQTYLVDSTAGVAINCHHVLDYRLMPSTIHEDVAAGRTVMRLP